MKRGHREFINGDRYSETPENLCETVIMAEGSHQAGFKDLLSFLLINHITENDSQQGKCMLLVQLSERKKVV